MIFENVLCNINIIFLRVSKSVGPGWGPAVLDSSDLISIRPGLLQSCSPTTNFFIDKYAWGLRVVTLASGDNQGQDPSKQTSAEQFLLLLELKFHKCSKVNILHLSLEFRSSVRKSEIELLEQRKRLYFSANS